VEALRGDVVMKWFMIFVAVLLLIIGSFSISADRLKECSNVLKLDKELRMAGVPIDGVSSDCVISFKNNATENDKIKGDGIVLNFNNSLTEEQLRNEKFSKLGISENEAAIILVLREGNQAPEWAKDKLENLESKING